MLQGNTTFTDHDHHVSNLKQGKKKKEIVPHSLETPNGQS